MAATLAAGPVATVVLAALQGASAVTSLVPAGRITDWIPTTGVVYPLILIESSGEQAFNTLGAPADSAFGSSVHVGVRVISQYRGDAEVNNVQSAIRGVLDGLAITVSPFTRDRLTLDSTGPMLVATVGGVTTREQVAEYEVTVHQ